MRAYYQKRAREYDDWWLGHNLYADKHRPGWAEERAELERWIEDLPAETHPGCRLWDGIHDAPPAR